MAMDCGNNLKYTMLKSFQPCHNLRKQMLTLQIQPKNDKLQTCDVEIEFTVDPSAER